MATDFYRSAQLAALAARSSANGASSVMFEIRQTVNKGPFWVPDAPADSPLPFDPQDTMLLARGSGADLDETLEGLLVREELLFVSSGGIEFQISTMGDDERRLSDGQIMAKSVLRAKEADVFQGRAVLNPAFVYESVRQLEILVEFGRSRWAPSRLHAAAAVSIARELAKIAAQDVRAPILLVHLPSAPYREPSKRERAAGSQEAIRDTHGYCIRMSIALAEDSSRRRLQFLEEVAHTANRWGLGLQISDRRPRRRRGEWITVRHFDSGAFKERAEDHLSLQRPNSQVSVVRPVTVAGPARVESSLAILSALEHYGVGITGISVSALQEIVFINLVVPAVAGADGKDVCGEFTLATGLTAIARGAGVDPGRLAEDADVGGASVSDYVVLVGKSSRLYVDDADSSAKPLWLTWDLPFGRVDLDMLLNRLHESLATECRGHVLQYARARPTPRGRLRGLAKASLQLRKKNYRNGGVREELRRVCDLVERDVRAGVVQDSGLPEAEVRIRVTWRERWLGSWDAAV